MQWNSEEFREYGENSAHNTNEVDYANPAYYHQPTTETPRSAQPVQSLEAYPNYSQAPTYDQAVMGAYRGPSNLEGYTTDAGAEQREAAAKGRAEGSKKRRGLAGLGGLGVAIGGLLLKFKTILVVLLNIKWIAFLAKFGFAGFSALISIAAYSLLFGWQFAVGLVGLLFIHEMGHALVMKLKGIPVGGLIFIPMLGAAVFMRQMPKNAKDEAEVGIAGPIAGAIASSACLMVAYLTPHQPTIWAVLAYFGFFMNLFNLIPVIPFDGGRVLAAIDRRIWIVGFLGLLVFQVWEWLNGHFSIWLLFFIFMAGSQFFSRRATPDTPEARAYYTVPISERIILGLLYFGLAAVLVLGMSVSHLIVIGAGQ